MKRMIALLLALMMLLALCACGSGGDAADGSPAGEAAQEEAAPESTPEPVPDESAVEVEINLGNWFIYFEITEEEDTYENAFGEVENNGTLYFISLKDEYADSVDAGQEFSVAFGITFDDIFYMVDESGERRAVDVMGGNNGGTATVSLGVLPSGALQMGGIFARAYPASGDALGEDVENIEVTRVQGSLYLTEDAAEAGAAAEAAATPLPTATPMPEPVEVEINLDNWSEYFEIVEDRQEDTNSFDEVDYVSLRYLIALKEEYVDKIATDQESKVAFMYTYDMTRIPYDYNTGEIYSDASTHSNESDTAIEFSDENYYYYGSSSRRYSSYLASGDVYIDDEGIQHDYGTCENFEVTRVEGSIFLYE